jgi:hypothetical protein
MPNIFQRANSETFPRNSLTWLTNSSLNAQEKKARSHQVKEMSGRRESISNRNGEKREPLSSRSLKKSLLESQDKLSLLKLQFKIRLNGHGRKDAMSV